MANAAHLRSSSANLYAIAQAFEANEAHAVGAEACAWNEACLRLMDVVDLLDAQADAIEGQPRLPLEAMETLSWLRRAVI